MCENCGCEINKEEVKNLIVNEICDCGCDDECMETCDCNEIKKK